MGFYNSTMDGRTKERTAAQIASLVAAREKAKVVRKENADVKKAEKELIQLEKQQKVAEIHSKLNLLKKPKKIQEEEVVEEAVVEEEVAEEEAAVEAEEEAEEEVKVEKKPKKVKRRKIVVVQSSSSDEEEEIEVHLPKSKKKKGVESEVDPEVNTTYEKNYAALFTI